MNVLGISGLAHSISFKRREFPGLTERQYNIAQGLDAAAALTSSGEVIAAAAEERFNRQKATNAFPGGAIRFCLERANLKISDVDFLAHGFCYEPHRQIIEADDYGSRQYKEVFAPDLQKQLLTEHFGAGDWDEKFVAVPHHLAHAASTFYPSGFKEALILVSDGMGEVSSMTMALGQGSNITELAHVSAFHSLGALYGVFTLYLGFYMNSDEYKVMGLAPYGNARRYFDEVMGFVKLKEDGTYTIPLFAHNQTLLERETHRGILKVLSEKFGPAREPEAEITQIHKDIAAALQMVLQTTQLHVLRHFKKQTGLKNLCLAGGVALNCSTNGVIRRSELFENVFVQPAAGDDGTALGAALYAERLHDPNFKARKMTVPLWGPEFGREETGAAIDRSARPRDFAVVATGSFSELCKEVALRISRGEIIGWFQGRMEFGPRALGSRSILADPRDSGMRERINALVKKREGFRPFAPVVTREKAAEIFEIRPGQEGTFSHMLYVTYVRGPYRDKLPATTHVDGSARAQTVSREQNPKLWQLLKAFEELSGIPVLLNTSFNVRGQPIVCTPQEAIDTFLAAKLDALVLGDTLIVRTKAATGAKASDHLSRQELEEAVGRNEEFWVNRLCSLQPVSLPYPRAKKGSSFSTTEVRTKLSKSSETPPFQPQDIVTAFAAFIARAASVEAFDLALADWHLSEQVGDLKKDYATCLPANFAARPEDTWEELCASGREELARLREHSTYALDVTSRHPALCASEPRETSRLPLAARFCKSGEDFELVPGSELTLNIPCIGGVSVSESAPNGVGRSCVDTTDTSSETRIPELVWCFDPNVFERETVASIANHFEHFSRSLIAKPEMPLREISLLSDEDWRKVMEQWNATAAHFPSVLMHEPFEEHAAQAPELVALAFRNQQITYGELNARAEALAHKLRDAGVQPDHPVGVYVEVSLEMMIGLLAVLKAGGAYLPLDPGFPQDRIAFMLDDSKAGIVLTSPDLEPSVPRTNAQVIRIDGVTTPEERGVHAASPSEDRSRSSANLTESAATMVKRRERRAPVEIHNLAYVIYTSGSTGKPKGVMIEHRNVANFYHAMDTVLGTKPGVWLAVTSISFDISILELFWTLSRGFKVVLQPKAIARKVGAMVGTKNESNGSFPLAPTTVSRQPEPLDFTGGQPTAVPLSEGEGWDEGEHEGQHPKTSGTRAAGLTFSLFYFAADENTDSSQKYRLLLEGAKFADTHGFEAVWTPERHFHSFGGLYPNPSVTSAAVAAVTQRVKIRAGSVVAPLHDPIRIAEEWSVVDNLSDGRIGISFASGWQINDFILRPENYGARKERMLEYIDTVRRLWRGETIARKTPNRPDVSIQTLPRPIQRELPIWITASGNPETFKLAGELGASVLTHLLGQNVTELKNKIAIYRQAWEEAGHDGTGHVTLMLHTYVHKDADVAREAVRKPFTAYLRTSADLIRNDPWAFSTFKRPASMTVQDRDLKQAKLSDEELDAMAEHAFERHFETSGLFGTPDHCLELIGEFRDIGVNEIGCLIDFGLPVQTVLDGLQEIALLQNQIGARGARMENPIAQKSSGPAADEDRHVPEADYSIPAQILRHKVTHMQCTPSLATMLLEDERALDALKSLKKLLLGGEALPLSLVQKLDIPGEILNMYGPTETTIWSAVQKVDRSEDFVTIGRPIANTQFYIVNKELRPVPVGVPGELLIGGTGVVRGYLRRPELTGEKFIPKRVLNERPSDAHRSVDPAAEENQPQGWTRNDPTLYRTGDLVRHLPDGRIEFLGRLDYQVKLRGYRIELGEIESALRQHPSIKDCAAIVREDVAGDKRLFAYLILKNGQSADNRELRQFLGSRLPDYMVPSAFMAIGSFPLTPNGKLDRKSLPRPDSPTASPEPEPRVSNLTEAKIGEVMCGVLGIKQIGLTDDFFELGGNSLLATQVIARLRQAFHWELPLRWAFEFPTVESLARAVSNWEHSDGTGLGPEGEGLEAGSSTDEHAAETAPPGIPLSFAQQRIWFLHQLEPGSHYNDHFDLRIRGRLDASVLKRTINEVVRRHQTLRSTFKDQDGQPQLVILPELRVEVPVVDVQNRATGVPASSRAAVPSFGTIEKKSETGKYSHIAAREDADTPAGRNLALMEAARLAAEDCQKPFDLENGPLLRAKLVRLAHDDHVLILTFDHIVIDGWSHGVFLSELTAIYQAFFEGRPSPLPELPIQYSDYAGWQLEQFRQGAFKPHADYWKRHLQGAPPVLKLATDFPRPKMQSYRGAREFFQLNRELMDKVSGLARNERCTPYMVLLAAFQLLLARRSGQTELVIGTPVANRNRADVEPLIGSFMNTLALRTDLSGEPSYRDVLGRVRQVVVDGLAHQELPFEKLVAELQPERVLGYSPVFQVMFILQNTPTPVSQAGDVSFRHFDIDGGSSKMDLTLNFEETAEGAEGWFEYATDLFRPDTIRSLVVEYIQLLKDMCARPERNVQINNGLVATTEAGSTSNPFVVSSRHFNGNGNGLASHQPAPVETGTSLPQIQKRLAAIWSAVLGTPVIGQDDHLFDLGGHSLLVTQIISRIKKTWGVEIPIHHLFENPTVTVVSRLIDERLRNKALHTAK